MEFKRAEGLDTNDPTPWLYSALLKQSQSEINDAVTNLEKSIELNGNRAVYRSQLLLDEDQAVRSANLATAYLDDGMTDVSVDEAGKAVNDDYANYSAHLFLANSYNALRDPNLINLRYESATFSEYLLANLLSPVGGSKLSSFISQQEYSKLFEQEGAGFSLETAYLSSGDWQQQASLYGWQKNTGYAVDLYYRSQNGERVNNDVQQLSVSAELKQQLSLRDSIYLQAIFSGSDSGDLAQYYNQGSADPNLRVNDHQLPNLFLVYNHEWSPGIQTLLLVSRLTDKYSLTTANVTSIPGVIRDGSGVITNTVDAAGYGSSHISALQVDSDFAAYSAELQQIAQLSQHTLIAGARYQNGSVKTSSKETRHNVNPPYGGNFGDFIAAQTGTSALTRLNFYGYDQWNIFDPIWLTVGLSYDVLRYPINVDLPPISNTEQTTSQISPKAGFVWTPAAGSTFRGAYTRSLGGLFYDGSVRLEPVQVAGFNQAYRSLIPESIVGAIPGSKFQTFDLSLEQKFKSRTYLVAQLELLQSDAQQDVGAFNYDLSGNSDATPTQLDQKLRYEEKSLILSANQLVGRDWALGAHYKLSYADLKTDYPDVSETVFPDTHVSALLHTLDFDAIFNHPNGFFAEAQALWRGQTNYHDDSGLPGDNFWQFNIFAGWRFAHRRAELSAGLLNLTGQDYHLNPLNLYQELPRERTLEVSFKLNF